MIKSSKVGLNHLFNVVFCIVKCMCEFHIIRPAVGVVKCLIFLQL